MLTSSLKDVASNLMWPSMLAVSVRVTWKVCVITRTGPTGASISLINLRLSSISSIGPQLDQILADDRCPGLLSEIKGGGNRHAAKSQEPLASTAGSVPG